MNEFLMVITIPLFLAPPGRSRYQETLEKIMTTTAFDDQFVTAPEPVRQPYDTASILRRNVADLELALRTQTERAEAAEAEMTKARKQKPLTWGTSGELMDILKNPIYSSPAPVPAPAVPSVVFMAHNKTSSILFAARKDADQYAASFGPAAGVSVTECAVIGSQSAPQAPAAPEEWRKFVGFLAQQTTFPHPAVCICQACTWIKKARTLLQSAEVRHD